MRNVGAVSGVALGSPESSPSDALAIQPFSIRVARGRSRWVAGMFISTAPLGRMRVPSKNDASPSFSHPTALVASETNWCAASWKSVPTIPSNPPSAGTYVSTWLPVKCPADHSTGGPIPSFRYSSRSLKMWTPIDGTLRPSSSVPYWKKIR